MIFYKLILFYLFFDKSYITMEKFIYLVNDKVPPNTYVFDADVHFFISRFFSGIFL